MVPLEMIWKMAGFGAETILDQCRPDRQYGVFYGQVQLEDEGMTDVHVSNYATVDGVGAQDDLVRRSRERLGMRQNAAGALRTDYDNVNATYDMFRRPLLVV